MRINVCVQQIKKGNPGVRNQKMYAYIKGIVDTVLNDRAVIETGGIGYEIICSANTLKKLQTGKAAKLFIHFQIAQDAASLYGFYSEAERTMFRKLINVSRIGPKVALNVLSVLTPDDVALAVMTDNTAAFDAVPGMGKKTAARVILELKGKVEVQSPDYANIAQQSDMSAAMRTDAIEALIALGYDGASAGRVVSSLPEYEKLEDMVKAALREISRTGKES